MSQVMDWMTDNFGKVMLGMIVVAVGTIILVVGFAWGVESSNEPASNVYTVALQATDGNTIALVGNSVTGEVECWDAYGIVKVIGSYSAVVNGLNITSSRSLNFDGTANGSMTNITMNMEMVSCVGTGTWKGRYTHPIAN